MPRYFTRPRSFWVEDEVAREGNRAETPMVPEHVAVDTGLLDANGGTIWRAPDPIGFKFGED